MSVNLKLDRRELNTIRKCLVEKQLFWDSTLLDIFPYDNCPNSELRDRAILNQALFVRVTAAWKKTKGRGKGR